MIGSYGHLSPKTLAKAAGSRGGHAKEALVKACELRGGDDRRHVYLVTGLHGLSLRLWHRDSLDSKVVASDKLERCTAGPGNVVRVVAHPPRKDGRLAGAAEQRPSPV